MKMYKNSATHIRSLSDEELTAWVSSFDTVLTDCDGVLWNDVDRIAGSCEVINRFREMGKQIFFVTNNSTRTREEIAAKAIKMKFNVTAENVISTGFLVVEYLKRCNFTSKVYVIGSTTGMPVELDAAGIRHTGTGPDVLTSPLGVMITEEFNRDPEIRAVVVGFDEHFSFPKLFKAATYLSDPTVIFLATNTDERIPLPDFVVPGTGSIVHAVETAAGRKSVLIGKPNPQFFEGLVKNCTRVPERTLMIGDRCNTDILFGKNFGFQTLLVETGVHKYEPDVKEFMTSKCEEIRRLVPDLIAEKLGDLLTFLPSPDLTC